MEERSSKVGQNEALYRAVNEKIEDLSAAFGTLTDSMTVICECGDGACAEQIDVPVADYERIRSDAELFVIRPGHEVPDVEDVEERHGEYDVVRKRVGEAAELAHETDPRA